MQFVKNISAVAALFAAVAVAAPLPEPQGNLVVLDSHGQPGVPVNNPQTVTQTRTAGGAAPTVTVTHTAGQPATVPTGTTPQQPQQPSQWTPPAQSSQASIPIPSVGSQTQQHHTASSTQSSPASSPTGGKGGKSGAGATGGKLTIVNNCKNTIYYSEHQNLGDDSGDYKPIAPGSNGYSSISGVSQAVWITNNQANTPYAYGDRTTGQTTGNPGAAIVEWNVPSGGGTPFLDLSLIKGNPFVTQHLGGQTLKTPCANPHITSGNQFLTSCNADNWNSCVGTYFDNIPAHDSGYGCSNLDEGLVFTACAFA